MPDSTPIFLQFLTNALIQSRPVLIGHYASVCVTVLSSFEISLPKSHTLFGFSQYTLHTQPKRILFHLNNTARTATLLFTKQILFIPENIVSSSPSSAYIESTSSYRTCSSSVEIVASTCSMSHNYFKCYSLFNQANQLKV
jgi:hypothetical protein